MVPTLLPSERRTGVPSTRSLAISVWDWICDWLCAASVGVVSVCMVASIRHSVDVTRADDAIVITFCRQALFPRGNLADQIGGSEQRQDLTDLKRSQEDRPIGKADRKRDCRLALEHRPLAECRHQARRRALAGEPARPGNRAVDRIVGGADFPLGKEAPDVEHLDPLPDPDPRPLQMAAETPARCELERSGADGDHTPLLNAGLDNLDLPAARLP